MAPAAGVTNFPRRGPPTVAGGRQMRAGAERRANKRYIIYIHTRLTRAGPLKAFKPFSLPCT